MIWNIVTDSSCDLKELNIKTDDLEIRYFSVPFVLRVEEQDFVDDDTMVTEELVDAMEKAEKVCQSACPSPGTWAEAFSKEGNVIAVTISKELSGSYNSACTAVHMIKEEEPDKKIAVINSISAGTGLNVLVRKLCAYIQEGKSFEEVVSQIEKDVPEKKTIFALCSFENLVKNGRMSKLAGFVAKKLGFWGIGIGSQEGTIVVKEKVRGTKKAVRAILADMQERGEPKQYVLISHCQNEELANVLKEQVLTAYPDVTVEIHPTKGLCSFYAERHGVILGYL